MNRKLAVILALVKKDLFGLFPLVLISLVTFLIVPVIANLDLVSMGGDQEFWLSLQANIYWLGFVLGMLLTISVIHQDPASSLNHDWLTRPISRNEWLLGKGLFLLLTFLLPVLVSRLIINLSQGMSLGLSLNYALGVESLEVILLVPLFIMAALLTASLRKLIMLIVGVFFVFLLPGWSVTRPMLSAIGIELGGEYGAMMWVQGVTIVLASLIGAALIYWFLYCRRQSRFAHLAFWLTVAVMFFSIYTPQGLYNWDRAIAINAAVVNTDNVELEENVVFDQAMACFPAAIAGSPNSTEQENTVLEQADWVVDAASALEPGALTFATPIRYREKLTEWFSPQESYRDYSVPWRLDWVRSQARFSADSLQEDVLLRSSGTALNRYQPLSATNTQYWTVPSSVVEKLRQDETAELVMKFDTVLLKPTTYELPIDGRRHSFPNLGACKAEMGISSNRVDIECLKRGVQPELISAQFIGMDSSRVDAAFRANYTHDWIEAIKRQRYELTLDMPNLLNNPSIMISAYEAERFVTKELEIFGILGNDQSVCPLPGQSNREIERAYSWSDKSAHKVSYVSVQPGVRLEVLDWRGQIKADAPTLVLLPGLGATAHSYDDIASKLSQHYNVVGITRRGTGDSSKPERGYDAERLSQDVLQVMDALEVQQAILVGHSFGGEELSYLGSNQPERSAGLIYLDAAYDRVSLGGDEYTRTYHSLSRSLPTRPLVRPSEAVSYEALQSYSRRIGQDGNVPEGEIIASYDLSTGEIKHESLYLDALMQGIVAPDYASISVPALSLYAVPASADDLKEVWYDSSDPRLQPILEEMFEIERLRKSSEMEKFSKGVKDSRTVALEGADHHIFISNEEEVLANIQSFIESISGSQAGVN